MSNRKINYNPDYYNKRKQDALKKGGNTNSDRGIRQTIKEQFNIDPNQVIRTSQATRRSMGHAMPTHDNSHQMPPVNQPQQPRAKSFGDLVKDSIEGYASSLGMPGTGSVVGGEITTLSIPLEPYVSRNDDVNEVCNWITGRFLSLSNSKLKEKVPIVNFNDHVDKVSSGVELSRDEAVEYVKKNGWKNIAYDKQLPEDFILEFFPYLNFSDIIKNQSCSENMIMRFGNQIHMKCKNDILVYEKWYKFMQFVKISSEMQHKTVLCVSKDFFKSFMNEILFRKRDFFSENMKFNFINKKQEKGKLCSYEGNFQDKVFVYSMDGMGDHEIVCCNGSGNWRGVSISNHMALRPNEFKFTMQINLNFDNIEIFSIFNEEL